jgi:diadenosine tetraphosphate (Ap4A) HIT family hydrolase
MERLWAGWRSEYVSNAPDDDAGGCVLCRVVEDGEHVVWRGESCAAILNAFPYTSGHLMVLPVRHVGEIEDLSADESTALWATLRDAIVALKAAYSPDGLNVGANIGRGAGAGVPGHFHVHALPRWTGDTNFMTAVTETRVLPEALPATLEKVRAHWPAT